jgi:hypothetical protein
LPVERDQRCARGPACGDAREHPDPERVARADGDALDGVVARGGCRDRAGEAAGRARLGVARDQQLGDVPVDGAFLADAERALGLRGQRLNRQRRVDDQERCACVRDHVFGGLQNHPERAGWADARNRGGIPLVETRGAVAAEPAGGLVVGPDEPELASGGEGLGHAIGIGAGRGAP